MPRPVLDGKPMDLTKTQWKLLKLLLLARGEWISRDQFMDALYGDREDPPLDGVIWIHMHLLRRKLAGTRVRIETFHGVGAHRAVMENACP